MGKVVKAPPLRSRDVQSSLARIQVTSATPAPVGTIKVWATQKGFYGGSRQRPGSSFYLTDPKHFSAKWMSKTDPKAPVVDAAEPAPDADRPGGADPIGAGE